MTLSVSRIQHYLKSFKLEKLFIEELGWDRHSGKLLIEVDGTSYTLVRRCRKARSPDFYMLAGCRRQNSGLCNETQDRKTGNKVRL